MNLLRDIGSYQFAPRVSARFRTGANQKKEVYALFKAYLLTLLMAMVPVIELRGAIPFGTALGIPLHVSVILSIIGNMIPVPFIILFIRNLFAFIRVRSQAFEQLCCSFETHAKRKEKFVLAYGFLGLCIIVAIPLPGTGAWTGSLVAALLEIRLKRAIPAIFLGVCIAATVISIMTYGFIRI